MFESGRSGRFFYCQEEMIEVPQHVLETIEKIVSAEGFELVHVDFRRQGRSWLLRIDIDKEGGVTVGDCSLISQQVSTYLDVDDFVPDEYELQVSSPGLDRKFYRTSDYQKFLGRLVRVKTDKPVRGLHVIVGHLKEFNGDSIIVNDPGNRKDGDYHIDLNDIKETRLEVEL
jgi:ribosome maturation factor RimP